MCVCVCVCVCVCMCVCVAEFHETLIKSTLIFKPFLIFKTQDILLK